MEPELIAQIEKTRRQRNELLAALENALHRMTWDRDLMRQKGLISGQVCIEIVNAKAAIAKALDNSGQNGTK